MHVIRQHLLSASLALFSAFVFAFVGPAVIAQQPAPFSSSADYRGMLQELQREQPRPTAMGNGTLLRNPPQPVRLQTRSTGKDLRISSEQWQLKISKDHLGLALTNRQTGLTWRLLGSSDPGSADGISWVRHTPPANPTPPTAQPTGSVGTPEPPPPGKELHDPTLPRPAAAPMFRPTSVTELSHTGNTWKLRIGIAGLDASNSPASNSPASNSSVASTQTVDLTLAVLSPSVIHLSLDAASLDGGASLRLNWTGAGPFFGLGERFRESKLDGIRTTLRPEDLLGQPGHNWTYIPVPLLYSPRGLGLFLDTGEITTYDLTRAAEGAFSIELDHASLDAFLLAGAGPKEILQSYATLTGATPLPPPWAFGVWLCAYQTPERVLDDARRLREYGIPSSAIWLFDAMDQGDIMGWPLWWTGYYPRVRAVTDQLHQLGFKALTYVHPYLRSVLAPYNLPNPSFLEQDRNGFLVHDANGRPAGPAFEPFLDGNLDFTNPRAVDWYEGKLRHILLEDNFDGWMEDYGEWVNDGDRFADGNRGRKLSNLNPFLYHKITYEISRAAKPDVVEFVRSGYAGSQAYTRVVWGGDQFPNWSADYGLPSVVNAGITAGLSGFGVWGPDIADNGHSRELWTRWTEFGALSPIMRNHPWDKPENAITLWTDKDTRRIFRDYARLHVSLFPYLYTYAHESSVTGLPIMRHPMLASPDDPATYNTEGEYLLGNEILVAPVLKEGATTRSLYVPRGAWVDFWTGDSVSGGQEVTVPAPVEHIPILVRAGSILPFISPDTQTLAQDLPNTKYQTLTGDLTWRIFPSATPIEQTFKLYDGRSANLHQDATAIRVQLTGASVAHHYEIVLPVKAKPREVRMAGVAVPERTDAASNREPNWRLEPGDHSLHILCSGTAVDLSILR